MTTRTEFTEARREMQSLLAPVERRTLKWLAERMPAAVNSDHLTALGLFAMLAGGIFYAFSARDGLWLHAVNVALLVNWFGDSLDGSLARHRNKLRPRYGFYVDHIVDIFGAFFLLGGMALSGHMDVRIALGLLVAYFALNINIYLTTYVLGVFKISYGPLGGTELRILLAAANLSILYGPPLAMAGRAFRLFDVAGVVGIVGITAVLVVTTIQNTIQLYRLERV